MTLTPFQRLELFAGNAITHWYAVWFCYRASLEEIEP